MIVKKKIWLINHYAGAPGVGRGLRHFHLAKEWGRLDIDVTVVAANNHHLLYGETLKPGYKSIEGVPFYFLKVPGYSGNGLFRILNMLAFLFRLIFGGLRGELDGKPNIIVASSPHPFSWLGAFILAKRYKAKLIFEVRDIWPMSLVELAGLSSWHPLVLLLSGVEWLAYRCSDLVVSNLPFAYEHMEARGMNPDKFLWVPNGVIEDDYADSATCSLAMSVQRLKSNDKFVVIYAGGHGAPNALGQVIESATLLEGDNSIVFVLVGDGEEKQRLKDVVEKRHLTNVVFYDPVTKKDVDQALMYADVGLATVHPNRIYEFGVSLNKLYDYMLAKLPVLYVVPSRYDPVSEASCGITVTPGCPEKLAQEIKMLSNLPHSKLTEMGGRGYKFVKENHNYKKLAIRFMECF